MGRTVISFLLTLVLLMKMPAANAQRSIQQYLHLTSLPYATSPFPATLPTSTTSNLATSSNQITSQPRPTTGLPSLAGVSLPSYIAAASQPQKEECETTSSKESNVDRKLLNNFAIALQLLILSSILNSTPTDAMSEKFEPIIEEPPQIQSIPQNACPSQTTYSRLQTSNSPAQVDYSPQTTYSQSQSNYSPSQSSNIPPQYTYSQPQNSYNPTQNSYSPNENSYSPTPNSYSPAQNQYYAPQPEQGIPSANLLGFPSFADPKLEQALKRSRSSFNLMSPYEAMAQPYSEPSPFTAAISRRDFQSPYALIDTNLDFFPLNDLFSF